MVGKKSTKQIHGTAAADERDYGDVLVRSAIAAAILLIDDENEPAMAANILRLVRDRFEVAHG